MVLKVLYFAWVRERLGTGQDVVESKAQTVADLIAELRIQDATYASVFSDLSAIRVAVDQTLADFETSLTEAKEIAFFPPMTGG